MGSLNASGISVVSKNRLFLRSYGRNTVTSSGTNPYGAGSSEILNTAPPLEYMIGFTSGIVREDFYVALDINPPIKIVDTRSGVLSRHMGTVAPTSGTQPEIALKPVSQNSSFMTGARIVTTNSDTDTVISRASNSGVRPPG